LRKRKGDVSNKDTSPFSFIYLSATSLLSSLSYLRFIFSKIDKSTVMVFVFGRSKYDVILHFIGK